MRRDDARPFEANVDIDGAQFRQIDILVGKNLAVAVGDFCLSSRAALRRADVAGEILQIEKVGDHVRLDSRPLAAEVDGCVASHVTAAELTREVPEGYGLPLAR